MEDLTEQSLRNATLVVALVDVAGFAKACEGKSSTQMFTTLDRFYELVGRVVSSSGGSVVKFMGDAALIVFPDDRAGDAVPTLKVLSAEGGAFWTAFHPDCRLEIKAHIGPVTCGPMGVPGHKHFDVIGHTVNDLVRMPRGDLVLSDRLTQRLG